MNKPEVHPLKQWRRITMPPGAWGVDIRQLLLVCGRALDLRVAQTDKDDQVLEVFCATDDALAQAEMLVHQSAADEVLRIEIRNQSGHEIGRLVDSVLKRSTGG